MLIALVEDGELEKRAQVFVSSTYVDLVEERQAVTKTLLELDCFPAGMELFPAGDEDKWDLIKGVIDDSDYYVLILSGKYGSIDEKTDISYTEMEYEYAVAQKKPVLAFIRKDLTKLPFHASEKDPERRAKLEAFHDKVKAKRNVKFFKKKDGLAAVLATSLVPTMRRHPPKGWVRGDQAMTPEIREELATLRAAADAQLSSQGKPVFDDLEDGNDSYEYAAWVRVRISPPEGEEDAEAQTPEIPDGDEDDQEVDQTLEGWVHPSPSWNRVFTALSPTLLHETTDGELLAVLERFLKDYIIESRVDFEDEEGTVTYLRRSIKDVNGCLDDTIVQFLALRLIERGDKRRSTADRARYWKLTQRGEDRMMQLRARRRAEGPSTAV